MTLRASLRWSYYLAKLFLSRDSSRPLGINGARYPRILLYPSRGLSADDVFSVYYQDPYAVELFQAAIRPNSVVADIGANIGYWTLIAARRAGKVFAFEPAPDNVAALRMNVEINRYDNVVIVPRCMSSRAGTMPLFLFPESPGSHSAYPNPLFPEHRAITVECDTLDHVLADTSVDVVKIDVEGHEPDVLDGMRGTIDRSPGLVLFTEVYPPMLAAAGTSAEKFVRKLETTGFQVRLIDEESRRLESVSIDRIDAASRGSVWWHANLYCEKRR